MSAHRYRHAANGQPLAPRRPQSVETWTEAFVEVGDLGKRIIPIWIPGEIDDSWTLGERVDIGAYYFRGYAFVATDDSVRWTPIFVAGGLDRFVVREQHPAETFVAWLLLVVALAIIGLFGVMSHRDRNARVAHKKARASRRRHMHS